MSASSSSSSTESSGVESGVASRTNLVHKKSIPLSRDEEMSILSFTPAFTFSFTSLPAQYKARNDAVASNIQPLPSLDKKTATEALSSARRQTNQNRPKTTNQIAKMSKKFHRRVSLGNEISKYVKKLDPIEEKARKMQQRKDKIKAQSIHKNQNRLRG